MEFYTANEAKAGLSSGNFFVQIMAAHFFKENPAFVKLAMPFLLELMIHEQPLVRDAAVLALSAGAEEAPEIISIILERMESENDIQRAESAHAAGYCVNYANIFGEKLIALLKSDSSVEVKRRAAQALGRLVYHPGLPALKKAAKSKIRDLKEEAENAFFILSDEQSNQIFLPTGHITKAGMPSDQTAKSR